VLPAAGLINQKPASSRRQFILLSPCAFLAHVYVLLPRLAISLNAYDCLPISGRVIKWIFITADVTTVLAQLAGTALTITFGDLVKIGKWVSRPSIPPAILRLTVASGRHWRALGPACLLLDLHGPLRHFHQQGWAAESVDPDDAGRVGGEGSSGTARSACQVEREVDDGDIRHVRSVHVHAGK
jgi:hypothetical protein